MYGEEAWEYATNQVQKSPFVWFCLVKVWTSHFYGPGWGYLFPVDIQSNDELGLVMMERNECLDLIETFKLYIYVTVVMTILPSQQISL